jgi:hypothetical protein
MFRKTVLLTLAIPFFISAMAQQKSSLDSIPDYDALFSELESFLDSITAPRSFTTANISVSNGFFQYQTSNNAALKEMKRLMLAPAVGYYHKSGLGLSVVTSIIKEPEAITPYQTAVTASYDYLKNRKFLTGVSFGHYFIKEAVPFYTSPLSNQVFGYFSYRGWWLKPSLSGGYGWGSTTSVEERKEKIKLKKGKPLNGTTTIETTESISDVFLTASVKHDFYRLNVLSKRDYFRVTPQLVLNGGTQKFGLAQNANSYLSEKRSGNAVLYNTENTFITERSQFQLFSLSARLRTEFSKGIFFVQPQLMLDYYLPEPDHTVATSFVLNAGILF